MDFREQAVAELRRRSQLLAPELAEWRAITDANRDGMGIHQSQIKAVTLMFEELMEVQEGLLAELDAALGAEELAESVWELGVELSGAHGLIAIFRHILAQRLDSQRYRATLDAADLVAAECYRSCIRKAQDWGVLGEGQFRVPPLTFLNARPSPQAITRRHKFGAFGFDLQSYEEQTLPISVISLRYHDTTALWSLCSLYHETGHLLDQDLGLRDEMAALLSAALEERTALWADQWVRELIADAFGVLLGGAGFGYAMADMLLLPTSDALSIRAGEPHPAPYLRISLLCALLRHTAVPALEAAADGIETTWQSADYYGAPPTDLSPYLEDCQAVARVLLDEALHDRLRGRFLRDLVPNLSGDHTQAANLAAHLRGDEAHAGGLPDQLRGDGTAVNPATFPVRLVPAAARLAVQGVGAGGEGDLATIQERALAFRASIPHDEFMAPGDLTAEQEDYLRSLARRVRFAKPQQKGDDDD